MKKIYLLIMAIAGIAMVFLNIDADLKYHLSATSYLDTPVPNEIQRHFKKEIKWDKWRQEAWLRGDITIDSNSTGQKWLFIKHHRANQTIPENAVIFDSRHSK